MNHRLLTARAALLAALCLAPPLAGCLYGSSQVEQGNAPTTGVSDYDAFFKEVVEVRAATAKAESEEGAARERLAVALGLPPKSDIEDTVQAAQDRAKQLRDNGIQLHLELTPEPRMVKVEGTIPLDGDGATWIKVAEDSAKSSLDLSLRLGALPERVGKLEKKRTELLASTKSAFKTAKPAKRRDIEHELESAEEVLSEAEQASVKYSGLASRFVLDLARAVETGGASAAIAKATKTAPEDPPPQPPPTAKPPPRWKAPPRQPAAAVPPAKQPPAATRPASATPPPPPPAKPGKPADDFDP